MKRILTALLGLLICTGLALAQSSGIGGGTQVFQNWYPLANSPSVAITNTSTAHLFPGIGPTALVCNVGGNDAFISPFGVDNTIVATTNSFWLPSGQCRQYNLKPGLIQYTYFAAITASSTTTIYVETGQGAVQ